MAVIDPDAARTMHLVSELLEAQEAIERQRAVIFGLTAALRASQALQLGLADLLDTVLAGDDA